MKPDCRETPCEAEMKYYVLGFAFSSDRESVLLIRKRRPEWQAGFFNGIGGKCEEMESPKQAMIREFEEETGVQTEPNFWELAARLQGRDYLVFVYSSFTDDVYDAKTVTDEEVTLMEMPEMWARRGELISNSAWLISLCLDPDFNKFTPITVNYV